MIPSNATTPFLRRTWQTHTGSESCRYNVLSPTASRRWFASKPRQTSFAKQLKAPAIFGVGLYIGLMLFGEYREKKEGSSFFAGLREQFRGSDGSSRESNDGKRGQ